MSESRTESDLVVPSWMDYPVEDGREHSVVGTIKVMDQFWSPELENHRDILVYLPPSYDAGDRRYPVIYMHDGQNLFDKATSFADEWAVDEVMEDVSQDGLEAIVVGIPNMEEERCDEYSPFADPKHGGGKGDAYLYFIVNTLKPAVDRDFRTNPAREHTGIAGSSMGGLISLYAFFRHPDVFGFTGVMSPALWFAKRAIFGYVEQAPFVSGKIYLDVGTQEGAEELTDVRRLRELLIAKDYQSGRDFFYVVEVGGRHEERAWARRLRKELKLLLGSPPDGGAPVAP